ncbi:hypothetical protein NE237_013709 [Protea cynaroides]|uniref:Dof zinc finger protein n=1 Tax=Protea cynaroides TaxID=273540 RepID=A0A9Q0JYT5_9MAGN|nr:hypothetical protein NE237_013709 [Protea cynaroides]
MHPHLNQALKCPRCDSINTKFCYFNNYNLYQPRHFYKSCPRYWTKGGVLWNIPIGSGYRKTKQSKPKPNPKSHEERKSTTPHSSIESSNQPHSHNERGSFCAFNIEFYCSSNNRLSHPHNLVDSVYIVLPAQPMVARHQEQDFVVGLGLQSLKLGKL